jgi:hypothetical protein
VIRTESTDAVRVPPEFCIAESAAPKLAELMSEGVQERPHRSVAPPYDTKVSVAGQATAEEFDLSVVPIVPPFTMRIALSMIWPPLAFLYSHST